MEIPKELKGKALGAWMYEKLDEIADNICTDPVELRNFVKQWQNGFYSYSLNNTLLIWAQKPEAIESPYICGYKGWQKKSRCVNRGEKAIRILAPYKKRIEDEHGEETFIIKGFFPISVFHVSQTSGEDLKDPGCPDLISGDVDLNTIIKACPFPVRISDEMGFSNGQTDGKIITIAKRENDSAMVHSLCHEWSHALMHFKPESKTLERRIKECDAEISAYIVTSCLGFQNRKSELYIGNWKGTPNIIRSRGITILKTAENIIRAISLA
jgi:hypothetical protein